MRNDKLKLSVFYDHIITGAFQKEISITEAAKRTRQMGMEYVDLNSKYLLNSRAEIMDVLQSAGLKIGCICHECELTDVKDYTLEFQMIDLANELGVKEVLILPGLIRQGEKEAQTAKILNGIRKIGQYALDKKVELGIEPYDNAMSPLSGEGVASFLDECDFLKCVFDTGNFMFWAEDEVHYINKFKNKVMHVHLKDRSFIQNGAENYITSVEGRKLYPCAVGGGVIHLCEVMKILQTAEFDGIYSIEHYNAEDMFDYMKKSVEWIVENAFSE